MAALLAAWRAAHGQNWQLIVDVETGHLEMLFGGRVSVASPPVDDDAFVAAALDFLSESRPMHGIDADTLDLDRAMFLPLGLTGSTDKMTVRFREEVAGVPVEGGFVNVLLAADAALLAIQSTGLPGLPGFPTVPTLTEQDAEVRAAEIFEEQFGQVANSVGNAGLRIDQIVNAQGVRTARLAWLVDAYHTEEGVPTEGRRYSIDALDGTLVREEHNIHRAPDVSGKVSANATPGVRPDIACVFPAQVPPCNPPVPQLAKEMTVIGTVDPPTDPPTVYTTYTDEDGEFVFSGVNTNLQCDFASSDH